MDVLDENQRLAQQFGVFDNDPVEKPEEVFKEEDFEFDDKSSLYRKNGNRVKNKRKGIETERQSSEDIAELSLFRMQRYADSQIPKKKKSIENKFINWVIKINGQKKFKYDENEFFHKIVAVTDSTKKRVVSCDHILIYKSACVTIEHSLPSGIELNEEKLIEWKTELKKEVTKVAVAWKNTSKDFRDTIFEKYKII